MRGKGGGDEKGIGEGRNYSHSEEWTLPLGSPQDERSSTVVSSTAVQLLKISKKN